MKECQRMPGFPKKLIKSSLYLILALLLVVPFSAAYADDQGKDFPTAPPDTDISDICTLSDCNPANPCPDPDEMCYTLNGVFYCCVSPPVPGMEAVGD